MYKFNSLQSDRFWDYDYSNEVFNFVNFWEQDPYGVAIYIDQMTNE